MTHNTIEDFIFNEAVNEEVESLLLDDNSFLDVFAEASDEELMLEEAFDLVEADDPYSFLDIFTESSKEDGDDEEDEELDDEELDALLDEIIDGDDDEEDYEETEIDEVVREAMLVIAESDMMEVNE